MAVLGVDGWRGAWVGALLDGRTATLVVLPDAAAVLAVPDVEVVGIDMPVGLAEHGPRACDVAARRLLGRAGSPVFPAPLRPVRGCASGGGLPRRVRGRCGGPAGRRRDGALRGGRRGRRPRPPDAHLW